VLLELHFESPALYIDADAAARESVRDGTTIRLQSNNSLSSAVGGGAH
jgi:hypothetical protein